MGWKHFLMCHGVYSLSWCLWLWIWRTAEGTWTGNQLNPPSVGSRACVCTAYLQRSIWFLLCIRRLTLVLLSSVRRKFCRVCLKHLHSCFLKAFGNPWSSRNFASNPAIWDPPLLQWSILQERGAKRIWLQTWVASNPLLIWGADLQRRPSHCCESALFIAVSLGV